MIIVFRTQMGRLVQIHYADTNMAELRDRYLVLPHHIPYVQCTSCGDSPHGLHMEPLSLKEKHYLLYQPPEEL